MRQLCECGCGDYAKEGNRFIHGHSTWNKGKTGVQIAWNKDKSQSPEHRAKNRAGHLGQVPWNKGKTGVQKSWWKGKKRGSQSPEHIAKAAVGRLGRPQSPEHAAKSRAARTYKLKDWQEKCPLLTKMEEMKEENGQIWVHCTNHNCPNSKENGGWFIPTSLQISNRAWALNNGNDNRCFYCSESCKETCRKFGKHVSTLIKQDEIAAGIRKVLPYTSEEKAIWEKECFRRQKEDLGGYNECEYCGNRNLKELSPHHEKPVKTHPYLALDPDNCIIACNQFSKNKCHYKYGHRTGTDCSTGKLASKVCTEIRNTKPSVGIIPIV